MKRVYLFTLLCVVFALLLTGCGGGSKSQVSTGAGQVVLQTGDAVNDQIAKLELNHAYRRKPNGYHREFAGKTS
jgi:hypothetical protein